MNKKHFFTFWSAIVIFVFITSLFSTVPVLADDSTPPPATEEPALPPTEEPAEVTETETVPTDLPEIDPTSTPEAVDSNPTPEIDTPAEVLESAPQGVDVVVLDENGNALPLATEEAAQIIMSGDPIWCPDDPDGTPQDNPTAGVNGCTDDESTFAALLGHLNTGAYTGNGTIFVSYDYSASENLIYIDHTVSELSGLGNLTIQGGWDFGAGGMHDGDSTYQSTLSGTWLFINNWDGNVTINNLFIANSNEDGLVVVTNGDVTLDHVNVDDSNQYGAYIDASGDVNVTNSSFTGNGGEGYYDNINEIYEANDGLYVETDGDVTLANVYSSKNGANGATLYAANVMISDSTFEFNGWGEDDGYGAYYDYDEFSGSGEYDQSEEFYGGNGLTIDASEDVTLTDVVVSNNAGDGADIEAGGKAYIANSVFVYNGGLGSMYISNYFYEDATEAYRNFDMEYEAGSGLIVEADGDITLVDVVASKNAANGADLESNGGDIRITDSLFEYNGEGGDLFDCYCGYELMQYYLDAFCDPDFGGPLIFNPCEDSGYIEVQGPFFEYEVDVYADMDENYQFDYGISQGGGAGLYAYADDSVVLQNVEVNHNTGEGAYISAGDGVEVTSSNFKFNGSLGHLNVGECAGYGMQECVEMDGEAVETGYGAYLDVEHGDGLHIDALEGVTLYEVNALYNGDDGALVHTDGSVFIEKSTFSYNAEPIYIGGEDGLFGEFLDSGGDPLFIPASEFSLEVSLVDGLDGDDGGFGIYMEMASGSGLEVETSSSITLADVSAQGNAGDGAALGSDDDILIADSNFNNNGFGNNGYFGYDISSEEGYQTERLESYSTYGNGLYLDSGAITLAGVTANNNGLYGAEIYAGSDVFIQDSQFSNNGGYGYGAYEYEYTLGYYDQGLGQFIVIDETSEGGEWYGSGLYIETDGSVTLKDVDANGNELDGAEIYADGSILVICGNYNVNGEYGIYAEDASSLELAGPVIQGNGYAPDEYFFAGTVILSDEGDCTLPKDKDRETLEGPSICEGTTTATFLLPNGDFVVFPCPIKDQAFVEAVLEKDLPGKLDESLKFLSALNTKVIRDNAAVEELEKPVVISFLIPKDVDPKTLSIRFWNGTEWISLAGETSDDGLYFEVSTNLVGTFVLVSE